MIIYDAMSTIFEVLILKIKIDIPIYIIVI